MAWAEKIADKITDAVTDKSKRLSYRAALAIVIVTTLFTIDNVVGFSFHYRINNKLEQIEKVNLIIQSNNADSTAKRYAYYLRSQIINRKSNRDTQTNYFLTV